MRVLLESQLHASRTLDPGTRLGFLFSFVRAELQMAAIAATEYTLGQVDAEDELAVDAAKKILHPLDGDMVGILDTLLPLVRSEQWPGCCKPWFEKAPAGVLSRRASAWVNVRTEWAHGNLSREFVDKQLPVLEALATDLLSGLADLLPKAGPKDMAVLAIPGGSLELQCVFADAGKPVLLRDIRASGGRWLARFHAVDPVTAREGTRQLDPDHWIPAAAGRNSQEFVGHQIQKADGGVWRPSVRLPGKQTAAFQGRTKELAELRDWYNDVGESKVCLVYGEGGVGKTTLALEFLNDLLDQPEGVRWFPAVITFYSAKQTRWSPEGLVYLKGVEPAISEGVRTLAKLLERRLDKAWFQDDAAALVSRAITLFTEVGLKRDDILIVVDNTETLSRNSGDERQLAQVIGKLSRLGRVLLTSRRREAIEARPVEISMMDEETGCRLLRALAQQSPAPCISSAGDAKLKQISRKLSGRPLLLEVFARHASKPGASLERSLDLVLKAAEDELGDFLYADAWERLPEEHRTVFFALESLGGHADSQTVAWICTEAEVPQSVWIDKAFQETRFGSMQSYGASFDLQLELGTRKFLAARLAAAGPQHKERVRAIADKVTRRQRQLLAAATAQVGDRIVQAFRSAPAKAAWLAAKAGNVEDALLWHEEAVKADPDNAALWERYAWYVRTKTGNGALAMTCALQACKLAPDDPEANFTAGWIAAGEGDPEQADRHLERAREHGKPPHMCHLQRARARIQRAEQRHDITPAELTEARALLAQSKESAAKLPRPHQAAWEKEYERMSWRLGRVTALRKGR